MKSPTNRKEWEQHYRENEARQHKEFMAQKHSPAELECHRAAELAKAFSRSDGLEPLVNDHGDMSYTQKQAQQAACHGREDSAAIFLLMLPVLEKLNLIRNILIACLVVLAYIAIRLTP